MLFVQVLGAVLVLSMFARVVQLYLDSKRSPAKTTLDGLDYRVRGCTSLRLITDRVVRYLRTTPDRVVSCVQMQRIVNAPSFVVGVPVVANMNAVVDFSEKFKKFAKKMIDSKCVSGEIRYGGMADSLEEEVERVCANPFSVSLPKISISAASV